jgi:hypothetical protein
MASYGHNNTSSLVDQQQVDALRRELAAKDEANFELSATLAAVEAETSHRVQQVENESGSAVKKLEEQLRRAQQEANLARSQAVQLQSKLKQQDQQFQQQVIIQNQHQKPMVTPINLPRDTRIATAPAPAPAPASSEATVHQPSVAVTAVTPESSKNLPISSGQRLAQHLLRTTAQYSTRTCQENNNNNNNNNNENSAQLQHAQQQWVLLLSRMATIDSDACTDLQLTTFCIEQCVQTGKQSPVDPLLLHLQLTWLQDALSYSPDSCRALVDAIVTSAATKDDDTVMTDYRKSFKRSRPSGIRVAGSAVQDDSLSSIANALMNPLWTPSGQSNTNVDDVHTLVSQESFPSHLQLVSELAHNLAGYILDPCSHQAVSISSMRILGLLLTHVVPETTNTSSSNDSNNKEYNASDVNMDKDMDSSSWVTWWKRLVARDDKKKRNLLSLWEAAAAVILDRRRDVKKSTRRLPDADMDPTSGEPDPDDMTIDTEVEPEVEDKTQSVDWQSLESAEILNWMAESLHLMNTFWKLADGSNFRGREWWETGRTRRLTAGVLDIVEGIVLVIEKLHTSALSLDCIAWLQGLLIHPRGVMMLRTGMATNKSTVTNWHRAVSAIAVMVRFLHCIVIRQHDADHLPRQSRATNDQLNPARDSIIRFLDGLLRIVQEDRRILEQKGKLKKATKVVSFFNVLSEYREMYTSAAALLLTVTDSSSCKVDNDVTCLLRLQMEELVWDEEEQEAIQT